MSALVGSFLVLLKTAALVLWCAYKQEQGAVVCGAKLMTGWFLAKVDFDVMTSEQPRTEQRDKSMQLSSQISLAAGSAATGPLANSAAVEFEPETHVQDSQAAAAV